MKSVLKKYFLIILSFLIVKVLHSQQLTVEQVKASYIYNFAKEISWSNINQIDTFKIILLSQNDQLYSYLKTLEKTKIHNKPVKVLKITKVEKLYNLNPQILYIDPTYDFLLSSIFTKFTGKHTLIITDNTKQSIYTMINFYINNNQVLFKINKENLENEGFNISEKLLILGGSPYEAYELFKQKQQELERTKKILKYEKQKLDSLQTLVKQQELIFKQQKAKYEQILKQKTQQIQTASQKFDSLQKLLAQQETNIKKREVLIKQKQQEIEKLKEQIEEKTKIYQRLSQEIAKNRKIIEEQQKNIQGYKQTISTQKQNIKILAFSAIILTIILIIIYKQFRVIKKYNRELKQKNAEIEAQREELRVANEQLNKLSIVAKNTDNVVLILDSNGTIEWINEAIERKYKFPRDKFIGKKLQEVSSVGANRVDFYLKKVISSKKSIVYENRFKTGDGKDIWVRTTLTPVLDIKGNVDKVIAIDTEITELLKAQQQIQIQAKKLMLQKEEIEQKNKLIESSLEFAKTIQAAILPTEEKILKYFQEYFLIYMPLSIVSGDIYWLKECQDGSFYVSLMDCTGHGVPGAFVSLIAERMLEETIYMKNIKEPKDILSNLDKEIKSVFGKADIGASVGMDMVILNIKPLDNNQYRIKYSGAKRPFIYYKPGDKEITLIKTTRRSIGAINPLGISNEKVEFDQGELILPKNTVFYLFSDGYTDQRCSIYKKRIGTQRFMLLINEIKDLPFEEQKQILIEYYQKCLENEFQRDDVTIWTLRL